VPKRPSSAAARAKPVALADKIKPEELAKIEAAVKRDKEAMETVMFLVHEVCFERYQAYELRVQNHQQQKQKYYASLKTTKKKDQDPSAAFPDFKEKPPMVLPCQTNEILNIFSQNKGRAQTTVSESQVSAALSDFFKPMNVVKRIVLYRDVINKSQRRGKITLHSFYINTMVEEQQLYMFYQKPDKVKGLSSSDVAKEMIKEFEAMEWSKAIEKQSRLDEKLRKKDDKY
jgi:hypothetical protein